ncbi:MAG: NADH-quinone oxidoreductase subunit A [Proteobacteria bacterium]|nr:NADH-quinone oxidoreductase subunit A [Pseudomonadota bacterium]NDC23512.1 NADH-quinone oxidoreductase subunit A [Pseudomonadota bacterium]NDD03503.1 NADH-quinone oxidoreductase subunit A [Pseudomonadota bacterium]NDG26021.1 NADH-quinone oxidoreductase subunit A [Pseudomonadota bacterium]
MAELVPIAILLGISLLLCSGILLVTQILGPKNPVPAKLGTYECGVKPEGGAHIPFKSSFYLIAVLFLLFDVEAAFFLPWALVYKESLSEGPALLWAMLIYMGLMAVGLIYILRKKILRLT